MCTTIKSDYIIRHIDLQGYSLQKADIHIHVWVSYASMFIKANFQPRLKWLGDIKTNVSNYNMGLGAKRRKEKHIHCINKLTDH
jgi:hypothetical protein